MAKIRPDSLPGSLLEWQDPLAELTLRPALDGAVFSVPIEFSIPATVWPDKPSAVPDEFVLFDPGPCELRLRTQEGPWLPIAWSPGAPVRRLRPGPGRHHIEIPVSSAHIAMIEQRRDGKPPRFDLWFEVSVQRWGSYIRPAGDNLPHLVREVLPFEVEHRAWTRALREGRFSHHVLIEIPIAHEPMEGFEDVHVHIMEAIENLDRGGEVGWKGCVAALRDALDGWPKIERSSKIHFERSDDLDTSMAKLRQALRQVTHNAHHSGARGWTRADAIAMLAGVAGQLARASGPHR